MIDLTSDRKYFVASIKSHLIQNSTDDGRVINVFYSAEPQTLSQIADGLKAGGEVSFGTSRIAQDDKVMIRINGRVVSYGFTSKSKQIAYLQEAGALS